MLKLKEGFEEVVLEGGAKSYRRVGASISDAFAEEHQGEFVAWKDGGFSKSGEWSVWPDGGEEEFFFDTRQEAHNYLLSVGSESPWEEVGEEVAAEKTATDTLARLITAAENVEFCFAGFVVASGRNSIGECYAEIERLNVFTGEHPTLNAALEALLDCKVGAVTVAQILGVA